HLRSCGSASSPAVATHPGSTPRSAPSSSARPRSGTRRSGSGTAGPASSARPRRACSWRATSPRYSARAARSSGPRAPIHERMTRAGAPSSTASAGSASTRSSRSAATTRWAWRSGSTRRVKRRRSLGDLDILVVVSEAAEIDGLEAQTAVDRDAFGHVRLDQRAIGAVLARHIEQRTGIEARQVVLGHLQRGGSPTAVDRLRATRFGNAAADLVDAGRSGVLPVLRGGLIAVTPLAGWHFIEHSVMIARYLETGIPGSPGLLSSGGLLFGGLPIPRPDLHFLYNVVETVPLLVAWVVELRRI